VKESGLALKSFESLDQVAACIFESGLLVGNDSLLGHLASNMNIDHIVIADSEKKMRLWRPGWHPGTIITPPSWIPNLKFLRLREKEWKRWISVNKVLQSLNRN
jgi:ADP-heptose:LPS heptosyltransferase